MLEKIRILPVLIISASLLLGLKVEDIWRNAGNLSFPPAFAQSDDNTAKNGGKKMPADTMVASKDKQADMADDAATKIGAAVPDKQLDINNLSPSELQLLQSLAKRRDEIDRREQEMGMREAILSATEKRIDTKIKELKQLEGRVQGLINTHDEEADKRLRSLVKVYESMKPKDAARIFENLDMNILLDVVDRMKESKMAPVLANMNSDKARELTVRLANLKKLPENGG